MQQNRFSLNVCFVQQEICYQIQTPSCSCTAGMSVGPYVNVHICVCVNCILLTISVLTSKQRSAKVLTRMPPMSLTLALMIVAVVALLMIVVEELQSLHDFVAVYNLI